MPSDTNVFILDLLQQVCFYRKYVTNCEVKKCHDLNESSISCLIAKNVLLLCLPGCAERGSEWILIYKHIDWLRWFGSQHALPHLWSQNCPSLLLLSLFLTFVLISHFLPFYSPFCHPFCFTFSWCPSIRFSFFIISIILIFCHSFAKLTFLPRFFVLRKPHIGVTFSSRVNCNLTLSNQTVTTAVLLQCCLPPCRPR